MKKIFLIALIISCTTYADEEDNTVQPAIGNFALSISQQLSPLFSFGQKIIAKKDLQAIVFGSFSQGKHKSFKEITPGILYGLSSSTALFFNVPVAASFTSDCSHSAGIGDIFIQVESALYKKETPSYEYLVTLVGDIAFPTGSSTKNPPTGFGSPSFFLGATASKTTFDWYIFACTGMILTTGHRATKFGDRFFYQAGIARNISYRSNKWMLSFMLEFNGSYEQRNTINNTLDCNSGDNTIQVGPSLWFSTKELFLQFGIAVPIHQHLFGHQRKTHYIFALNAGWTFHL